MDIAAIRSELADVLRTVEGIHAYSVIATGPQLPAGQVGPPIFIDYHPTFGSERKLRLRVLLEVSRADPVAAQRRLDGYLSWPGVPSTLEQWPATAWTSLAVIAVGEARPTGPEDAASLAVDLTVEITT